MLVGSCQVSFLGFNLPRAVFLLRAITRPTLGYLKNKLQQSPSAIIADCSGKMWVIPPMEKGKCSDYHEKGEEKLENDTQTSLQSIPENALEAIIPSRVCKHSKNKKWSCK